MSKNFVTVEADVPSRVCDVEIDLVEFVKNNRQAILDILEAPHSMPPTGTDGEIITKFLEQNFDAFDQFCRREIAWARAIITRLGDS